MCVTWSNRRYLSIIISFLFAYIIFTRLFFGTGSSTRLSDEYDDNNGKKIHIKIDRKDSSIIIDALIQPADSRPTIYSLISEFKNGIFIYNMEEPIESWWPFECIETKMKQSINTKLCIHDPKFDKHISAQLKENGLWEPTNVRSFLRQLNEAPDANVMDIGANIGLYTMLAAKLNRTVLAVEPLHENLNRLHKAAQLEGVQSNIIALVNALSNERKQLKVSLMDYNIGGSYVAQAELIDQEQKNSLTSSAVIVNSITTDDLVDVINYKFNKKRNKNQLNLKSNEIKNNQTFSKKFVMKLDIEGYEPFVFENSEKLFKEFQIIAIFMEMGKMLEKLVYLEAESTRANDQSKDSNSKSYLSKIKNMLRKFQNLNYEPYEVNGFNKLEYEKWREWPWDVYFRQCDLLNCPGHVYKLSGF